MKTVTSPSKVARSRSGRRQARRGPVLRPLPWPRARCLPRLGRTAEQMLTVRYAERHRRRVLLPEARADVAAARGSRSSRCSFRRAATAEEVVPRDAGGAGVDGEPRLPRAASASGPRRRSRSSRRAARRPRSGARASSGRRSRRSPGSCASALDRLRPGRLAEDVGLARHPRQRPHRAALVVRRGAPRGARARARGRTARARRSRPASGGRRSATASSSTTTRTRRTARSPARTPCARSPTRACPRRSRGTSSTPARPEDFTLRTMPARFARDRRSPCRHRRPSVLARRRCSSCRRARGRGPGRRPVAAHYAKQDGRAAARAAVTKRKRAAAGGTKPRAPSKPLDRDRARRAAATSALAGLEPAGRRAIRRRRAHLEPTPTSSSIRCADARRRGTACASTPRATCPRICGRRLSRRILTTIRTWAGARRRAPEGAAEGKLEWGAAPSAPAG